MACSQVPHKPFDEFAGSTRVLGEGINKALAELAPRSELRFKADLLELLEDADSRNPEAIDAALQQLESLRLSTDLGDPLSVTYSPLFFAIEKMRLGISQAHLALGQYAQLLQELANPNRISEQKFRELADEFNGAVSAAAKTLGHDDIAAKGKFFSAAAMEAAAAYLRKNKRAHLHKALSHNQTRIERFCTNMLDAIDLVARLNFNEHEKAFDRLYQKSLVKSKRKTAVTDLIILNRRYIREAQVLVQLRDVYSTLPVAHRNLVAVAGNGEESLSGIAGLFEVGKRLKAAYAQSLAISRSEALRARGGRLSAKAEALLAKSRIATADAAELRFEAKSALIEAMNDPQDKTKFQHAAALDEEANYAELEVERLLEQAKELERAASDFGRKADVILDRYHLD